MNRRTIFDIIDELEKQSERLTEEILEDMRKTLEEIRTFHTSAIYGYEEICAVQEPASQIKETESEIKIVVDLPFVKPENISIRLTQSYLLVEAKTDKWIRGKCIILRKVIRLNTPVDKKQSSARFWNGKLSITLKKKSTPIKVD